MAKLIVVLQICKNHKKFPFACALMRVCKKGEKSKKEKAHIPEDSQRRNTNTYKEQPVESNWNDNKSASTQGFGLSFVALWLSCGDPIKYSAPTVVISYVCDFR